ncbi:hypothetical protein RirG_241780 [Rhizophagus irregularis DAOM 197198w]|uniref:Uncharacterized protein n=1 Tax=Rhizophagus irregularis (strain DAOM 197198w) TaxID=1432141 RepID=A0A015K2Q4_RHIIW|nr:hypothetical protein RirG_241780 [Rhizophagus irregularis DAOM 197198w]
MATIREEIISATINRVYALTDFNIHNSLEKQHEYRMQTVLADGSLTKDEKSMVVKKEFVKIVIMNV